MILNSKHVVVIYIDHVVNSIIVKQTKLSIIFVDKLNLKLIRVFTYLFQFRLRVFHKTNKFNLMSNVFNRLFTIRNNSNDKKFDNFELNNYHFDVILFETKNVIHEMFIEMSFVFRKKLIANYKKNNN